MKTSRIGLFTFNATAPIVGGELDEGTNRSLTVLLKIDELSAGNRLLDSQARSLVKSGSDGILTFVGEGDEDNAEAFSGTAKAGDVEVPMTVLLGAALDTTDEYREVKLSGQATFNDVHIPLPGLSNIKSIDVQLEGVLRLAADNS